MPIFAYTLKKKNMHKYLALVVALGCSVTASLAQLNNTGDPERSTWQLNTITTAVPFLQITPDSRSGAMGDAGVALSPDANSTFWNAAKLAFVEDDVELAKQIFVDVANHALGVRKAITALFDQSKVINRALNEFLDDPSTDDLIRDRVDGYKDRVTGSNPNLMGAGSLADIIRTIAVGINGRISAAQEKTLNQKLLATEANRFFEVMHKSFAELESVASGNTDMGTLRKSSILGSSTMLRVMAGVYFELKTAGVSVTDIMEFFKKISQHTAAPISSKNASGKMWLNATTEGAFADGANAPGSRAQAVKALVAAIVGWHTNPPSELK